MPEVVLQGARVAAVVRQPISAAVACAGRELELRSNGKTRVSDEIVFLSADEEDKYTVAQANAPIDEKGNFAVPHVACRTRHTFKDLPVTMKMRKGWPPSFSV